MCFLKIELWTSRQFKNDTTRCGNIFHFRIENLILRSSFFVTFEPRWRYWDPSLAGRMGAWPQPTCGMFGRSYI